LNPGNNDEKPAIKRGLQRSEHSAIAGSTHHHHHHHHHHTTPASCTQRKWLLKEHVPYYQAQADTICHNITLVFNVTLRSTVQTFLGNLLRACSWYKVGTLVPIYKTGN
jgi:hypothetical protein